MNNECSVNKYKRAFTELRGRMTEWQYKMLLSHYRSSLHTTSPRRMAKALRWTNRGAANLHYGKFATTMGDFLKRSPKYNVELLCSFECNPKGEIVWVMHGNVVRALEELGWVNSQPRILASRGPYQARKKDLDQVRTYIAASNWRFAKSMPQWPHWYVVRERGRKRDFDFFAKLIDKNGYIDPWGRNRWKYLVVDDFKYWVCDDVLNRAKPKSNAWFIKEGKKYMAKHRRRRAWHP